MCFLCCQGDRGEMGLPGPPGEKGAMVRSKSGSRLCSQGNSNTHLTLSSHYNYNSYNGWKVAVCGKMPHQPFSIHEIIS